METRMAPRINVILKVKSEIDKDADQSVTLTSGNSFEVTAFDISKIGMGVYAKYFLPKGLVINLEIDGEPFGLKGVMKIKAEVRHSKLEKVHKYKCGIRFINISQENLKAIQDFIATYEKRKDGRLPLGQ